MQCVLCQQPLQDEAKDRLRRFVQFLEADTQKKAAQRHKEAGDLYKTIDASKPTEFPSDKTILDEIAEREPDLPERFKVFITALDTRRARIIEMAKAREIKDYAALPENPWASIKNLREKLNAQAIELDKAVKDEVRTKLRARLAELDARASFEGDRRSGRGLCRDHGRVEPHGFASEGVRNARRLHEEGCQIIEILRDQLSLYYGSPCGIREPVRKVCRPFCEFLKR